MDKLHELVSLCKASVIIEFNEHTSNYQSIKEFSEFEDDPIDSDILNGMIERDIMVSVQFYKNTPIGFYRVYHYDLDKALDIALQICKQV